MLRKAISVALLLCLLQPQNSFGQSGLELNNQGCTALSKHECAQAEKLLIAAYQVAAKTHDSKRMRTALNNLKELYSGQGRADQVKCIEMVQTKLNATLKANVPYEKSPGLLELEHQSLDEQRTRDAQDVAEIELERQQSVLKERQDHQAWQEYDIMRKIWQGRMDDATAEGNRIFPLGNRALSDQVSQHQIDLLYQMPQKPDVPPPSDMLADQANRLIRGLGMTNTDFGQKHHHCRIIFRKS